METPSASKIEGKNSPPLFPECDALETEKEKFYCFNRGLMKIVQTNFHYPEYLREKGIEDKVWVSFEIEKNGSIENINILHGEHDELNYETIRIVCLIPDVKPAYLNGEPISFAYTMPINFKLR